jgi:hypothetical protein
MTTAEIVVIIVAVVFGLLALGGARVIRRRSKAGADAFHTEIERANRDLAKAHAADNGWDPARVADAARAAYAEQRPGQAISALELVQVIDPPGTDDDKAIFLIDGAHQLTLGRSGDDWRFEALH